MPCHARPIGVVLSLRTTPLSLSCSFVTNRCCVPLATCLKCTPVQASNAERLVLYRNISQVPAAATSVGHAGNKVRAIRVRQCRGCPPDPDSRHCSGLHQQGRLRSPSPARHVLRCECCLLRVHACVRRSQHLGEPPSMPACSCVPCYGSQPAPNPDTPLLPRCTTTARHTPTTWSGCLRRRAFAVHMSEQQSTLRLACECCCLLVH